MQKYDVDLDPQVLHLVDTASRLNLVSLAALYLLGCARYRLCEDVGHLKLNCLVMGSRGLGTIQRVLIGSVSNYAMVNELVL
ncbi:hypothetical protein REPUB_Repub11eG0157100 [Reevesia pubescens]